MVRFGQHRTPTSFFWPGVRSVLLLLIAASCLLVPNAAGAKPRAWTVSGEFRTQILPPTACPPPSTLCATGTATGDLAGDVSVVIEQSEIVIGNDGMPYSRYSGTITIATKRGDLSGRVNGQVRLTDGALSSVVTFTNGTRGFHSSVGKLAVSGMVNLATGQEIDRYEGLITHP